MMESIFTNLISLKWNGTSGSKQSAKIHLEQIRSHPFNTYQKIIHIT
jgi:hypothetical protein